MDEETNYIVHLCNKRIKACIHCAFLFLNSAKESKRLGDVRRFKTNMSFYYHYLSRKTKYMRLKSSYLSKKAREKQCSNSTTGA